MPRRRRPAAAPPRATPVRVRGAAPADLSALLPMRCALWPDEGPAAHRRELRALLRPRPGAAPTGVFLAEDAAGRPVGFAECSLRSHANGCDPSRPVGFLEGWFVVPAARRRGVGGALVRSVEDWARGHGCRELASDTWIRARTSLRAHTALGFEVVDRAINFRKPLRRGRP